MKLKTDQAAKPFRKKVYSTHYSSPLSDSIQSQSIASFRSHGSTPSTKKIRPTGAMGGMREEFKKTFLPLYIDVFELKQMIETYKSGQAFSSRRDAHIKSPAEILARLQQMQNDVEESQKWCQGMILQISKAIEEAKEAVNPTHPPRIPNLAKRLVRGLKNLKQRIHG